MACPAETVYSGGGWGGNFPEENQHFRHEERENIKLLLLNGN